MNQPPTTPGYAQPAMTKQEKSEGSLIDLEQFRIRKFPDGWWSICRYIYNDSWGQWRGPFTSKSEAEIDCANAANRFQGKTRT